MHAFYSAVGIFSDATKAVPNFDIHTLELQVAELLRICKRLREENLSLRKRQNSLMMERATLLKKHEQARSRIESMIVQLKSMEEDQ